MVKDCEMGGATSVAVVLVMEVVVVVGGLVIMVVVVVGVHCFAWFSEKHCLLIEMSEGSFSMALISDLLPAGVVVVGVDAAVAPAVVEGVDVCALLLLLLLLFGFLSLSLLSPSSSLLSCWYISSTMGFHNRTLAFMNQFETCKTYDHFITYYTTCI